MVGMKQAVKPNKLLLHHVHYSLVASNGTLMRFLTKTLKSVPLDLFTEAQMMHQRETQAHIVNKMVDRNLTDFWLPELRRVLAQPQAANRSKAAHEALSIGSEH